MPAAVPASLENLASISPLFAAIHPRPSGIVDFMTRNINHYHIYAAGGDKHVPYIEVVRGECYFQSVAKGGRAMVSTQAGSRPLTDAWSINCPISLRMQPTLRMPIRE